jgi:predicted transcriptional regulator
MSITRYPPRKEDFNYAMQSAMKQLEEKIEDVCTTNQNIEMQLQSLMDRIEKINDVRLMSSHICLFPNNIVYRLLKQK